ncbi:GGDEF domain-containing protein [Parahaliea aestuarii]|uniref:diguanylate cyclase n=1 Tax=Parahaliea aestuarii TaxID=1852021 RepID=A0A5C9A439_9GAMM|nr:diguanylate cyclase [Parahaliea aestuarii]TXS94540.1 diguanylate cyclase [Parahaliea aestuarii]
MIYQRSIPAEELFSAQLEMLMHSGRIATVTANMLGVLATMVLFWQFVEVSWLLVWACAVLVMLLARSLYMSNALVERRYLERPRRAYWQLLVGAAITGAVWSSTYIAATFLVPEPVQLVFLLLIFMVITLSMGVTLALREYFIVHLFTSLWPIAWWCMAHYWEQGNNLLVGLFTLGVCAVLLVVSNRVYLSFRNMIALNWERETMSRELGDLTHSLRERNRQLLDARAQLTDLANVDELTGLGNRRVVNQVLREEINRARRSGGELSVIMLDVDYFKNYNDTYGHPAGDVVLQRLADLMQRATARAGEVVARYGGEEFMLILPGAGEHSALRTAGRLKELVLAECIHHGQSLVSPYITVSQGVVSIRPGASLEPADLVKVADRALYEAKDSGRNAIAFAEV